MKLTLETKNPKLLALLEQLAHQLGVKVSYGGTEAKMVPKEKSEKEKSKKLIQLMDNMLSKGGIKSISDPVKWQREIRKDRSLPGRD